MAHIDMTLEALESAEDQLHLAEGRYQTGAGSAIELSDAQVAETTAACTGWASVPGWIPSSSRTWLPSGSVRTSAILRIVAPGVRGRQDCFCTPS